MTAIHEPPAFNTSVITHSVFHNSSSFITQEHENDVFDKLPGDLVEAALTILSQQNISLVPWGSLLYRSMNVPEYLLHYQFFVPDELLDVASDMVSAMHLPLTSPPSLLAYTEGDLVTKGRLHRLTRFTGSEGAQYLNLLPLSFGGFLPSELEEQRFKTYSLLIPKQSAVYACILRLISTYPRKNSPVRESLTAELELLVNYNLLELPLGYRTPDTDRDDKDNKAEGENYDEWESLGIDERVEKAVRTVRKWCADREWRDGEEWMQDALIAIIRGSGDIDFLPWSG